MNGRRTSSLGREMIKLFEAFADQPYVCPAGKLTIGYGHVISMIDRIAGPIDVRRADELLAADLSWIEEDLNALPVQLTQGQFDALASLIYNIGRGAFAGSTLKKRLLARDFNGAAAEFKRWVHGGGKVLPGLVHRRAAEEALFLGES